MWMRTHLQYVDLPPHLLRHFEVLDFAFIQNLYSHLQAGDDVMCDCSPSKVDSDNSSAQMDSNSTRLARQ
jgi:hypothetical protein